MSPDSPRRGPKNAWLEKFFGPEPPGFTFNQVGRYDVIKTMDNGLNRGLLSFRQLEMFWHTEENISFASCF